MLFIPKKPLPIYIGELDPDSAVLFIHGLGGSYWTWAKFSNLLKSSWAKNDSFGLQYEEYYGEQHWIYEIPLIEYLPRFYKIVFGPDLYKLSESLESNINVVCNGYDNVVIVAHSMGGLIARKYIIDYLKKNNDVGKVRGLITYATPHLGSKNANRAGFLGSAIANLVIAAIAVFLVVVLSLLNGVFAFLSLTAIVYFYRKINLNLAKQIFQLKKGNQFIDELNTDWRDLNISDRIDFKRVVGYEDWIVDSKSSAYMDDENVVKIASKGHRTIIKPTRVGDTAFQVTYKYLEGLRLNLERKRELEEEVEL